MIPQNVVIKSVLPIGEDITTVLIQDDESERWIEVMGDGIYRMAKWLCRVYVEKNRKRILNIPASILAMDKRVFHLIVNLDLDFPLKDELLVWTMMEV